MYPGTEVSNDGRLRLLLLLLILGGLIAYAATQGFWAEGGGGEAAVAGPSGCPGAPAPAPRTIGLEQLGQLREGISSEAVFGVHLDSYEQGFVSTAAAFSDQEPTMQPINNAEEGVEAGYEVRWWTPSRHDVVADVWLFEDSGSAEDFVDRATSPRCRTAATAAAARAPAGGRNLEWRNPYGFMQQDLYLARGPRVYRLAVVAPGSQESPTAAERRDGFRLVDALGCELVGLACGSHVAGAAV